MFENSFNAQNVIAYSVLGIFILAQLIYHFVVFRKLATHKSLTFKEHNWQPVSIIVCARNEKENLERLIPVILEQNYPNFELIIADDGSWDGSSDWLDELKKTTHNLKVVHLSEEMKRDRKGKKFALTLAIKAASNEILLLTDADCMPNTNSWIKHMVSPYHNNSDTEIVIGHSPFKRQKGFLSVINIMENSFTAMSYLSSALSKKTYMGVGRNLSYKKSLFFKVKGFASHHHIAGGDDDLFIQEASNHLNTSVCVSPESFVVTYSKSSFADWFQQKKRHNFIGKYYKSQFKLKLGFFSLTHTLLWVSFFISLTFPNAWLISILIMLFYFLIKFPLIYMSFNKLKVKNYAYLMPLFDFMFLLYNLIFGIAILFYKQKKW